MARYYVTKTVHVAIEVNADTAEAAVDIAQSKDINEWDWVDEDQALAYQEEE